MKNLDNKAIFNALSNALHIFALKEDKVQFKLVKLINSEDDCKAVILTKDGELMGLYTDSNSAKSALNDVHSVFGDDQPLIQMHIKETKKGQSIYYAEIL